MDGDSVLTERLQVLIAAGVWLAIVGFSFAVEPPVVAENVANAVKGAERIVAVAFPFRTDIEIPEAHKGGTIDHASHSVPMASHVAVQGSLVARG